MSGDPYFYQKPGKKKKIDVPLAEMFYKPDKPSGVKIISKKKIIVLKKPKQRALDNIDQTESR